MLDFLSLVVVLTYKRNLIFEKKRKKRKTSQLMLTHIFKGPHQCLDKMKLFSSLSGFFGRAAAKPLFVFYTTTEDLCLESIHFR